MHIVRANSTAILSRGIPLESLYLFFACSCCVNSIAVCVPRVSHVCISKKK